MKKLVILSLMLALMGFTAVNVSAIPIQGGVSFGGGYTVNSADLATATQFSTFFETAVVGTKTGDYATVAAFTPTTFKPFSFGTFVGVTPLWTFTFSGDTYSFDATSILVTVQNTNEINMQGSGIAYISGSIFDPTPGVWYLTANKTGGSASFSSSSSVVPEPTTMLLLGLGLVGIAGIRRKFKG